MVNAPVGDIATVLDGSIVTVPVGDRVTFPDAPSVVNEPAAADVPPMAGGEAR